MRFEFFEKKRQEMIELVRKTRMNIINNFERSVTAINA